MIRVSKQVSTKWAQLSADANKPYISLLLVSRQADDIVRVLVEEAATEAAATLEREWELARETSPDVDLGVGAVSSAVMPDGVVITIGGGAEQFEQQVGLMVEALERRGVEGELRVFTPARAKALPFVLPLVECRLRVLGERYHLSGQHYRWRADREAWSAAINGGTKWCLEMPGQATVQVGLMPRAVVGPGADPARLVVDAAKANEIDIVDFASGGPERSRMVAVEHFTRRVSLIEASEAIEHDGWQHPVARMTAFLTEHSDILLYALIKHGTAALRARGGYSLADDWPPRAGFNASRRYEPAFEDSYAPDAFAVQLLGPGYAGRIPTGAMWRNTQLPNDRVLIEHAHPERWFDVPFAPRGGRGYGPADPPEVLTQARKSFASILFTDELVGRHVRAHDLP